MEQTKKHIIIVTADKVNDTGTISWKFIFDCEVDYPRHRDKCNGHWGQITDLLGCRHEKSSVCINIYKDGDFAFGWGNDIVDEAWLLKLIQEMPSATLLMKKEYAEQMKAACEKANVDFDYIHFEGEVKTA